MWGRVVELAVDNRHAFRKDGFLVVKDLSVENAEVGRVPLDDIEAVIVTARDVTVSRSLLSNLAERNCPVVFTDKRYLPSSVLLPITGHHLQAKRFDAQIAAGLPLRKRVWASVIKAKINQQAAVVAHLEHPDARLRRLAEQVRSGDPSNCEAQAAKLYWRSVFGKTFRRDRGEPGINSYLNYGYTILRAATARAIVASGLHPTLGIHHQNEGNPMRLVDDLMEPYRPFIDLQVLELGVGPSDTLSSEGKRALVDVLSHDLVADGERSPVGLCIQRTARSLASIYLGESKALWMPAPQLPEKSRSATANSSTAPSEC